ncbi:Phytochrome-like protein cph1 [Posidoniimonas polymericola]|uniref:histidine kinase n=1 Tax=Posidoniimonas polymericola TaxID=2528002 RepID=A0A5C5ZG21_9BACT|nr:ATP-binding protein [Posidoniimonas polymericola]TWT85997.1 Phytochrome-like protein cph1 [Posidoniimonas polymericola]
MPPGDQPPARPKLRLATLLSIFSAGLVLVTSLLLSGTLHGIASERVIRLESERMADRLELVASQFQLRIEKAKHDVQLIVGLPETAELLSNAGADAPPSDRGRRSLTEHFRQLLRLNPEYFQVRLVGAADAGREVVRVDRLGSGDLQVADRDALQQKGNRDYFQDALRAAVGETYVSHFNLNREHGVIEEPPRPTVRVAQPVYDDSSDAAVAVVVINIDLDAWFKQAQGMVSGEHLQLFVTNEEAQYLIHPDPQKAFGFERGDRRLATDDYPEITPMFDGSHENLLVTSNQDELLVGRRLELSGSPFLRQKVFVAVSDKQFALGETASLRRLSIAITALMTVAAVALAVLASRAISRPIHELQRATARLIESGPRDRIAEPDRGAREVAELAVAFNRMTATLQETLVSKSELEDEVARRERSEHALKQTAEQLGELNRLLEVESASLVAANEELDRFTYIASHDLRAPLRAIESLAGWLVEDLGDNLPEKSRQHLNLLGARVARMNHLLDDLLDYSRAGRAPSARTRFTAREVVENAAALAGVGAGFEVEIAGEPLMVDGFHTPLETILRNLIANAVKHHDQPAGRITVRWDAADQPDMVRFTVADDGAGIEARYFDTVFEIFQTLRPRDEVEGSGMGLALAKKLVTQAGGRIWLEPNEPRGARFLFTWPLNEPLPPAASPAPVGREADPAGD